MLFDEELRRQRRLQVNARLSATSQVVQEHASLAVCPAITSADTLSSRNMTAILGDELGHLYTAKAGFPPQELGLCFGSGIFDLAVSLAAKQSAILVGFNRVFCMSEPVERAVAMLLPLGEETIKTLAWQNESLLWASKVAPLRNTPAISALDVRSREICNEIVLGSSFTGGNTIHHLAFDGHRPHLLYSVGTENGGVQATGPLTWDTRYIRKKTSPIEVMPMPHAKSRAFTSLAATPKALFAANLDGCLYEYNLGNPESALNPRCLASGLDIGSFHVRLSRVTTSNGDSMLGIGSSSQGIVNCFRASPDQGILHWWTLESTQKDVEISKVALVSDACLLSGSDSGTIQWWSFGAKLEDSLEPRAPALTLRNAYKGPGSAGCCWFQGRLPPKPFINDDPRVDPPPGLLLAPLDDTPSPVIHSPRSFGSPIKFSPVKGDTLWSPLSAAAAAMPVTTPSNALTLCKRLFFQKR